MEAGEKNFREVFFFEAKRGFSGRSRTTSRLAEAGVVEPPARRIDERPLGALSVEVDEPRPHPCEPSAFP